MLEKYRLVSTGRPKLAHMAQGGIAGVGEYSCELLKNVVGRVGVQPTDR